MDEKVLGDEAGAFLAQHAEIEAIDAFSRAEIRPGYLGAECRPLYHATKLGEMERYYEAVPPLEYEWYLRTE